MSRRTARVRARAAGAAGTALFLAVSFGPANAGGRVTADPVAELGRRLFFDPAVSRSGDTACSQCHDPEHAFSSRRRFDVDDFAVARRHAQTLVDATAGRRFQWDGEFDSVADLVEARLGTPAGARARRREETSAPRPVGGPRGYVAPPAPPPSPTSATGDETGDPRSDPSDPPPSDGEGVSSSDGDPPVHAPSEVGSSPDPDPSGPRRPSGEFHQPGGSVPEGLRNPHDSPEPKDSGDASGTGSQDGTASSGAGAPTPSSSSDPAPGSPTGVPVTEKSGPTSSTKSEEHAKSVAERVEKDGRYAEAFEAAFGSREVSTARIAKAIAAFVESIRSTESPFDRFQAGDASALSEAARRGLALFDGVAGCAQCHLSAGRGGGRAAFTDHQFHVTGISARSASRTVTSADPTAAALPYDDGRAGMTKAHADRGAFKTPTLRDVASRGPFMHDGSFRTLSDVVRYYARGAFGDDRLDPRIRGFVASRQDVADLVAFLHALTSDVRPALSPDEPHRAARTTLRFVDAAGKPLVGVPVRLDPAGDRLPGDVPLLSRSWSLVTDAMGRVEYAPARRTHMRLSIPVALGAIPQGGFIPDTCREKTVEMPIRGRAMVLLSLPPGVGAPHSLVAHHERAPLSDYARALLALHAPGTLEALRERVATFVLEGVVEIAGRSYARYATWVPVGASESARIEVSTPSAASSHVVSMVAGAETRIEVTR